MTPTQEFLPVFLKMFAAWNWTVKVEICNASAMDFRERPSLQSVTICSSRCVRSNLFAALTSFAGSQVSP